MSPILNQVETCMLSPRTFEQNYGLHRPATSNHSGPLPSKKKTSVLSFLEELQHHLRKITLPRETYLVSMTPNLEWAIHRTGQKCQRGSRFHKPGQSALAVIDTHELSGTEGTIALRATDIIAYADPHSMKDLFDAQVRKWAANCDEYVAINVIPSTVLVKWIPWSDLYRPDFPQCLIPEPFTTWFTLGLWRQKLEKDDSPLHQVAKRIANFAQRIVEAGPSNMDLGHDDAISLIAHASDWGYKAANDRSRLVSAAMLHAKINAMVDVGVTTSARPPRHVTHWCPFIMSLSAVAASFASRR